ncbi:MAG: aldolase [Halobacteriota archaeon]|nr:aldolase [Halobacteriota archaeon]
MYEELRRFGKKLVEGGMVSSHSGNMSIRIGDNILITRSGSMLDELTEASIVEVGFDPSSFDLIASSETIVHRSIYKNTSALAVIHAHCPFAVILSFLEEGPIEPMDVEGDYFLHSIPILKCGTGSTELAEDVSSKLTKNKGVIVRGHGTFAIGKNIEDAYVITSAIEYSCKLRYYYNLAKK